MNKSKKFIAMLALFFGVAAVDLSADSPTAQFLLVGQGARAIGMGEAVVSNCLDYSAMYWNPAASVFIQDPSLGASGSQLPAGISTGFISFAGPTSIQRNIGIGIDVIHEGASVTSYDIYGNKGSDLTTSDMAIQTAIAFKIGDYLSIAPTLGIVSMSLDKYTSNAAANIGLSSLYLQNRFAAGFALANAGGKLEFRNTNSAVLGPAQPQPQLFRIGASYSLLKNKNLLLSYSLQNVADDHAASWSAFGAEFLLTQYFALRAGTRAIADGSTIPSFGIGFNYKRFTLDFAQSLSPSELDGLNTTTFDLQFRFKNANPAITKARIKAAEEQQHLKMPQPVVEQAPQVIPRASLEISTIAVAEFSGKNVSQADASIVSDFLRTELVNTGGFVLVEKANMDKLLAEAAFQQSGCSAADCAVRMGKILNVKYMLVGSLSKLLDTYYITVNLVSVETGEIVRSYNQEAQSARELKEGCKTLAIKIHSER